MFYEALGIALPYCQYLFLISKMTSKLRLITRTTQYLASSSHIACCR